MYALSSSRDLSCDDGKRTRGLSKTGELRSEVAGVAGVETNDGGTVGGVVVADGSGMAVLG